jgi:hypothetical protein
MAERENLPDDDAGFGGRMSARFYHLLASSSYFGKRRVPDSFRNVLCTPVDSPYR